MTLKVFSSDNFLDLTFDIIFNLYLMVREELFYA